MLTRYPQLSNFLTSFHPRAPYVVVGVGLDSAEFTNKKGCDHFSALEFYPEWEYYQHRTARGAFCRKYLTQRGPSETDIFFVPLLAPSPSSRENER